MRRQRGLTLTEVSIALVTFAIIGVSIGAAIVSFTRLMEDNRRMMIMRREINPIVVAFREMVDKAAGGSSDDVFVFQDSNTRLGVWNFDSPGGTNRLVGQMWLDGTSLNIQRSWPDAEGAWTLSNNVTELRFDPGPSADDGAAEYGAYELNSNRSVMMTLTLSINNESFRHQVVAFAPNVNLSSD